MMLKPLFLILGAIAIAMLAQQIHAAEWTIEPKVTLSETYTNNIRLAAPGKEKSDQITEISPALSLSGKSKKLRMNANYRMQYLLYAKDAAAHTTTHFLDSSASTELLDNLFFLDGRAAISQQNTSPLGQLTANNGNVTNNLTKTRSYSVSPYLRHNFKDVASAKLRYTHDSLYTSAAGFSNRRTNQVLFNLDSGSVFRTLGWGVNYNKIHYYDDMKTANYSDNKNYSGYLSYRITSHLTLKVTQGYEKHNYVSTGVKPEGRIKSAGFSWTPTERTHIEASAGRRYFGKTYMFKFNHRARKTVWSLGYNEDITSSQSQFLIPATINTAAFLNNLWAGVIPDNAVRQQTVDQFIATLGLPNSLAQPVNYLSNRIFLQKLLQVSVAATGARNTVLLSIFGMSRHAQTSAAFDSALFGNNTLVSNDRTRQVGGSAQWNWKISPRTNVHFGAEASATSRQGHIKTFKAGFSRQLGSKLSGTVALRRIVQRTTQAGGGYQENAISAFLLKRF